MWGVNTLTFFFALLRSWFTVSFGLQLFGVPLGTWLVSFIVFDFVVGVVVFRAKAEFRSDTSREFPIYRYHHHTHEVFYN